MALRSPVRMINLTLCCFPNLFDHRNLFLILHHMELVICGKCPQSYSFFRRREANDGKLMVDRFEDREH